MFFNITQKQCSKCKEWKERTEFYKSNYAKDGLNSQCKSCFLEGSHKYYQRNKEKANERAKKWVAENPEKRKAAANKYARNNYEVSHGWQKRNPDKARESKTKWRLKNPEKQREAKKKWYAANPFKGMEHKQNRRARLQKAGGSFTANEWKALKDFYNHTCLRCKRKEPEIKLTPDHVKPLALGGANTIDNIQPLCWSCNAAKQARHIDYR